MHVYEDVLWCLQRARLVVYADAHVLFFGRNDTSTYLEIYWWQRYETWQGLLHNLPHSEDFLKEKSSETETDTFILLPSFELRKGTYVFNVLTYYSPLDVAINHISSQFLCSAVLPQNCGGFFFVGLPGRWAKFRQGLAFSSFSKFPILGSKQLCPTGVKKVVMKSMKLLQKMKTVQQFLDDFVHHFLFIMLVKNARLCKIPCKLQHKNQRTSNPGINPCSDVAILRSSWTHGRRSSPTSIPRRSQNWDIRTCEGRWNMYTYMPIWGFPKMVVPNNHGFSY